MGVSKNSGTPKSSILSNRFFLGYPYFWVDTHMHPEAEKKDRETSSHDELKVENEEDDTNDVIRVLLQPLFFVFFLWVISGAKCPRNDG